MATLTVYADAADGSVHKEGAVWATQRGAATGDSRDKTSATVNATQVQEFTGTYYIDRAFLTFDTSAIPDSALILSATLYVKPSGTVVSGLNDAACLVESTQASATDLTTADFDAVGSTQLSSSSIDISSLGFPFTSYKSFPLNASGLAVISKTGFSKFALRSQKDLNNSAPSAGTYAILQINCSEASGTGSDPYLEVTYSDARTTSDSWAWSDSAARQPGRAATNTWAWSDSAAPYWRAPRVPVLVRAAGARTTLDGSQSAASGTITVASTTGFASSGTVTVIDTVTPPYAQTTVSYTGKTGTTFTGCTGGSGTFASGTRVATSDTHNFFPCVQPLDTTSTPVLMAAWVQKPAHSSAGGSLTAKKSTNGGLTWGSEFQIRSSPVNGSAYGMQGMNLLRCSDGTLLATWYESSSAAGTGGHAKWEYETLSYSSRSTDNGTTWDTPVQIPSQYGLDYMAVGITGILEYGGNVYVTAYGIDSGYNTDVPNHHYSKLLKTTDKGATTGNWSTVGTIATVAQTDTRANGEASLLIMPDGTWLSHLRCEVNTGAGYSTLDRYQATSTDAGVTWSGHTRIVTSLANSSGAHRRSASGLYLTSGGAGSGTRTYFTSNINSWPADNYRDEYADGTYYNYTGSSFASLTPVGVYDAVNVFSGEAAGQLGAQVWFQWYEIPGLRFAEDAWAWSDAAAITNRTYGKSTSDSWAWSDTNTQTVVRGRTTSDAWAWTDTATGAGNSYLSRTTSDSWAWSDSASRTIARPRTTSDAWAWSDTGALPSASFYSRTTTDTWAWTDSSGTMPATIYWLRAARRRSMSAPVKTYVQVLPKGTTRTTSYTSPTYEAKTEAGILVTLDVTAASGTGGLTVRINAHDQASSQAVALNAAPTAVTATGTTSYALYPFGAVAGNVTQATSFYLPRMFSISVTHGDSSSYTYSVGYCLLP